MPTTSRTSSGRVAAGAAASFGVVTRLRFALRPAPSVTTWYRRWDYGRCRRRPDRLAGAGQPSSPRRMWSTLQAAHQAGGVDPVGAGERHLARRPGRRWTPSSAGRRRGRAPAGRDRARDLRLPRRDARRGGLLHRRRGAVQHPSHHLRRRLARAPARLRPRRWASRSTGGPPARGTAPRQAGVSFDVLGRSGGRPRPRCTAFPHRRALAVAQYTVGWPVDQQPARCAPTCAGCTGSATR